MNSGGCLLPRNKDEIRISFFSTYISFCGSFGKFLDNQMRNASSDDSLDYHLDFFYKGSNSDFRIKENSELADFRKFVSEINYPDSAFLKLFTRFNNDDFDSLIKYTNILKKSVNFLFHDMKSSDINNNIHLNNYLIFLNNLQSLINLINKYIYFNLDFIPDTFIERVKSIKNGDVFDEVSESPVDLQEKFVTYASSNDHLEEEISVLNNSIHSFTKLLRDELEMNERNSVAFNEYLEFTKKSISDMHDKFFAKNFPNTNGNEDIFECLFEVDAGSLFVNFFRKLSINTEYMIGSEYFFDKKIRHYIA